MLAQRSNLSSSSRQLQQRARLHNVLAVPRSQGLARPARAVLAHAGKVSPLGITWAEYSSSGLVCRLTMPAP
jgi:hypothetical protein